ncbi:uncharacterized protein [Leptinotarsa decemlineata]|uniref:uncharacterized protein n=1 Tax=Leptinotarsa decemlineata TaxID=7539 RepID=UPI003D309F83
MSRTQMYHSITARWVPQINLSQVSKDLITVLHDAEASQKIILHMDNWIDKNVSEIVDIFKLLKRKQGKRVYIIRVASRFSYAEHRCTIQLPTHEYHKSICSKYLKI